MQKFWAGDPPDKCDLCGDKITFEFSDAKVPRGRWGILCPVCVGKHKVRFGLGFGQRYKMQKDGRWLKVEG